MNKRILIVNKFYYARGGAEVVAINLANELNLAKYTTGIFTMDFPDNIEPKNFYTAKNVTFKGSILNKIKFANRTLGYDSIVSSFKSALAKFNPDVVHLHNIHSYLSPVMAKLAKDAGCKVIWTLHDYKLICPSYSCLNKGKTCQQCLTDKYGILKNCCMKGSFLASALAFIEARKWNRKWILKYVDSFVCPSNFMKEQMIKGGYPENKLHVICNFIDPIKIEELSKSECADKQNYYTYIGRLSEEKGVETLLKAASKLPYHLKVVGNGPLLSYFKSKYNNTNIEYCGKANAIEVSNILKTAKLLVQPSECFENNPLSTIEALCAGTPVLGARIGGIPELININNGSTFTSRDVNDLESKIKILMDKNDFDYNKIKDESRIRFSGKTHLELLSKLYL